jgi:translation initiation factor 3 subunit L
LNDVKQRAAIPDTVSYLKLCTSISVSKLASFLKTDEDNAVQGLLNMKIKTRALRWRGGAPASGTVVSSAELDVAVSRDTVYVSEYKAARRFGEFFIRVSRCPLLCCFFFVRISYF